MARKHYKSSIEQIADYHNNINPTFVPNDETKYNPSGINEDKNYLNTDGVVLLNFDFRGKTGAVNYNFADMHTGALESQFKTAKQKADFVVDITSKYVEYVINFMNLNDLSNNGNVRDDRDRHHQTMSVDQSFNQNKQVMMNFKEFFKANVQANHEDWIDDIIGSNQIKWYDIPKILYSRGSVLLHYQFENFSHNVMVVHEYNKNAVKLAKKYGADSLYAAHTHKPRVLTHKYEFYNSATNKLERKTLAVVVAASSLPTSKYGIQASMNPVRTTGFIHEQYESKDKINNNFINEDGLYARFKTLKPRQVKRVDEYNKNLKTYVNEKIKEISALPMHEAIIQAKLLKLELYNNVYNPLLDKYESELAKEKSEAINLRKQHAKGEVAKKVARKTAAKEVVAPENDTEPVRELK